MQRPKYLSVHLPRARKPKCSATASAFQNLQPSYMQTKVQESSLNMMRSGGASSHERMSSMLA
eukprot:3825020-Amphidinium_carterae.1